MENNAVENPAAAHKPSTTLNPWEKFLQEVDPSHTSFFVKVGDPYDGVNFNLDPHVHKFEEADNLELLVQYYDGAPKVDLPKLQDLLQKCQDVQHLKFFGVKISKKLIKIITEHCPKLINLELNPFEEGWGSDEPKLDCLAEFKRLIQRCTNLATLILREPSDAVVEYIHKQVFDYDKIDRNFCFNHHTRSTYQMNQECKHQSAAPRSDGKVGIAIGRSMIFGSKYGCIYQKIFE